VRLHPHTRLSISLVVSLALWWPALRSTLDGGTDPLAASLRWVACFAVASVAVHLLAGLLEAYSSDADAATVDADDPAQPN